METGDLGEAGRVLGEAIEGARDPSDRGVRAHATVVRLLMLESTSPKERSQEALRELEGVIPVFEELGDDLGLARAWRLMADVHWTRARYEAVDDALRRAIEHARRAGAAWEEVESLGQYTGSGVYGPAPVGEVAARCDEVLRAAEGNPVVEARALRGLACVKAMEGRPDQAREMAKRARSILEDLGLRLRAAFVSEACGFVERLAGDHAAAERELRSGFEVTVELGEQGYLATAAALIAHEVFEQGRVDEADRFIQISEGAAAEDDLTTQALCRSARALVLAARGRVDEAEREAMDAAALAEETDDINMQGDVRVDLAQVLASAGRSEDAVRELERAREMYEHKGNVVSAELVARRIEELRAG
jgi:tetratricopeptide (TPR) repeat protein